MNADSSLFGLYRPGDSWLHRTGVGWKYVLVLALTIIPMALGTWWATTASLIAALVLLATAGFGPREALRVGRMMWIFLAVLLGFHLVTLHPLVGVVQAGNLLAAVLAARILTLTTPTPVLMDALSTAFRPLRFIGLNPEHASLSLALMIRSIPYLMGSVDDARDSAHARGLGRNPARLLTPVVLGAVAYAERTGDALQARGILERTLDEDATGPAR